MFALWGVLLWVEIGPVPELVVSTDHVSLCPSDLLTLIFLQLIVIVAPHYSLDGSHVTRLTASRCRLGEDLRVPSICTIPTARSTVLCNVKCI